MEGDVMLSGVGLPALLSVGGALVGGVFALLRWFSARMLSDIDARLLRIDEVEQRVDKLLADLPVHYMRREDHIRELTAIHAKLDRLYEILLRDTK